MRGAVDALRRRCRGLGRRLGLALATGYIFVFFAERMFWSRWRDGDDNPGALLATWLLYSFVAEICLIAIRTYRVRDVWPMFLVGAILGWLVEGVFTMTFFGAGGIPFPFTIAWTALSWHALIVVVIGWYGLQTALLHSFRRTAWLSAGLGLFWGIWSIYWDGESPVSSAAFAAHAVLATLALAVAFSALHALRCSDFRVSRSEPIVLAGIVLLYFFGVTVTTFSWLALVTLPPLFALIYLGLRRNRAVEHQPDLLVAFDVPIPRARLIALLLMPGLATAIQAACRMAEISAPTNIVVLAITLPAGAVGFVASLWLVLRRRPAVASALFR